MLKEEKIKQKERWLELCKEFERQGDFRAMRVCGRELLATDETDCDGLCILATVAMYMDDMELAAALIAQIRGIKADHTGALMVEACIYGKQFQLQEEIRTLLQVICQIADLSETERGNRDLDLMIQALKLLGEVCLLAAMPEKAIDAFFEASRLEKNIKEKIEQYSNGLFMMHYCDLPLAKVKEQHRRYNKLFLKCNLCPPVVHTHKRIRVGYISPDFRQHPVAYFIEPLLQKYTKERFKVYCYAAGRWDYITNRLKKSPVVWWEVQTLSAEETAALIYKDEIDILVDLSGHTRDNCLPVLARKPAPVQVSGIGYFNTTGLGTVDYFLSDVYCDPPECGNKEFTEKLLRLPHSHFCYTPGMNMPSAGPAPYEKNGWVTFGCFNNFTKVTDEMLMLWRAVMERVPQSRLIVKGKICSIPSGRAIVEKRLTRIGIQVKSVELRPYSPDYLEQYRDIDIALDTAPYPGGVTTCEALYMGVPVVTLRGKSHGARFGASLLENADLAGLVAESGALYIEKAVHLACNKELLSKMHRGLRAQMQASSLMNSNQYMKEIEAAYEEIWQQHLTLLVRKC